MPFRVLAGLLILVATAPGAKSQDEMPKGQDPAAGTLLKIGKPFASRYTVAIDSLLDYKIVSDAAERSEETHRLIVKEEFSQATSDGKSQVRCDRRSIETGRGGPVQSTESGRTFDISGEGKNRKVEASDGQAVDPDFADHLGRWSDLLALVPNREVQPGESWKVDFPNLEKALTLGHGLNALSFTCELQGVTDGVATIGFKVSHKAESKAEGEIEQESSITLELSGALKLNVASNRPLEVQIRGKFGIATRLFKADRDLETRQPIRKEVGKVTVEADRVISTVRFSYPE